MDQVRVAAKEQFGLLSTMIGRHDLFVPMLGIWVASFGGALHAPVTTYFQMEIGATTSQIGDFGAIKTAGVLLMSPVYGWMMDTQSAYLPSVLSAFCCTAGCLVQGFAQTTTWFYVASVILGLGAANFWNIVGTYVALATPRDQRSLVVSGYQVQVSALRLLGTSLYPSWDKVLIVGGVESKLVRYYVHMSLCAIFCVFAFLYLVARFKPVPCAGQRVNDRESKKLGQPIRTDQLLLLLATILVQAFGEAVVTVLWPLHIKKLSWDSHEFAYLQLASQLLIICGTLQYPAMTRMVGQRATASALPMIASFTCAVAFLQPDPTQYGRMVHAFNALIFLSVCGVTKVCFQHLTTLAVPVALQGRIFALVNMLSSLGSIGGNLFATRFAEHETALGGKGGTPFMLASTLFGVMGIIVLLLLIVPTIDNTESVEESTEMTKPRSELLGASESN